MARARPSALPPGLLLLLLLLLALLCPAARGDCGQPPEVINAKPILQGQTSFPEKSIVTYKCDNGFMKIPGQPDSTICLSTGEWSEILEFCNRSCNVPPRLSFASLKPVYGRQNYFPVGSIVEYECRPGYLRDPSLSRKVTCLQSLQWSKPAEFCKKKSCPNPGEIKNGQVNITTDLLFGSLIFFSCDKGYRLVGSDSSFCSVIENTVGWSDPLPECIEIFCPKPPKIDNGIIQDERENYGYRQSITYVCDKGFTLVGKSSIYCDMNDDQGEWSDQPPQCIAKSPPSKFPPTVLTSTTAKSPISKVTTAVQKPTTVNAPATSHVPVTKTTTRFHSTRTATERKEISTSDAASFLYGHTCIALAILLVTLVTIG
uniref:complement decay-accelerating factor n=1 Tax=Jaculus jaculus TaxID=51337 RepID=UPI001E1B21C6|nr:complement decay-accelerating factor [Jaculus jaculus]